MVRAHAGPPEGGLFRLPGSGLPVASFGVPVGIEVRLSSDGRFELRGAALADGCEVAGRMVPLPRDAWGRWRTTDLVRLGDDGSRAILRQADGAVMIGGVTVHPGAVAAAANGLPGARAAAVTVGSPTSALNEPVLVRHVETSGTLDEPALRQGLAETLVGPALPRRIVICPTLPRLLSGKVDLNALRDLMSDAKGGEGAALPMPDDLDRKLCQIAIIAFNLPPGTVLRPEMTADDIPKWDSFDHINLALAVEKAVGFRMQFNDLAAARSLSDMRKLVEMNAAKGPWGSSRPSRRPGRQGSPPGPLQNAQRPLLLSQSMMICRCLSPE